MEEDIMMVMEKRGGRYIEGEINFIGGKKILGRNWGCIEEKKLMNFEVWYNKEIDFEIEKKIRVVEEGEKGEKKIERGYVKVKKN